MSKRNEKNSAAPDRAILHAHGLVKTFKMGEAVIAVLKGVDIAVRDGEFVAIEGRSGSGKSTLLHILGALESMDNGNTHFDNRNYSRYTDAGTSWLTEALTSRYMGWAYWTARLGGLAVAVGGFLVGSLSVMYSGVALILLSILVWGAYWSTKLVVFLLNFGREQLTASLRNKEFGFVFQFYHLLPELNVLENTLLGSMIEHPFATYGSKRRELTRRAIALLTELGLEHRLKHRPNQLSGGERQRVAIARAFMNNPRVLFADEPTGNLDSETGKQIMAVLEKLHREQGQTIVMVTHDRAIAHRADRILILRDGKLSTPSEAAAPAAPTPDPAVTTLDYR